MPKIPKDLGEKGNLNVHVATVHEGQKSFKCGVCDKSFGEKDTLGRHVSMVHRKERPFE